MSTKKIKVKSSLSAINAREAAGRRKVLPKLKVVLANPYTLLIPKLSELETSELQDLICDEISQSNLSGREFAKENKFCLGLGSSLRAIGNKKTSCVLISEAIKPKFIVNQIGYLTREKSSTVPVYLVDNLQSISESLFGIKALVVLLPLEPPGKLSNWVSKRTIPKREPSKIKKNIDSSKTTQKTNIKNIVDLSCIYLRKNPNGTPAFVPETVVKSKEQLIDAQNQDWTGDFISFSKTKEIPEEMDVDEDDFEKEKDKVLTALRKMSSIKSEEKKTGNIKQKQISKRPSTAVHPKDVCEVFDDDCGYIDPYLALKVHKIQGNPNRKQKTKRKAKKKVQKG